MAQTGAMIRSNAILAPFKNVTFFPILGQTAVKALNARIRVPNVHNVV